MKTKQFVLTSKSLQLNRSRKGKTMANRVLSVEVGYSFTKVCELDYKVKNPKDIERFLEKNK